MPTSEDARSAWVEAQTEFQEALEEAQAEWGQATMELQVAVAAKATPPEMLNALDQGSQQVIQEVQRGRNSQV